MIFELFYQKIIERRDRKKNHQHEWRKTGFTYNEWRALWSSTGMRDTFECETCHKKKKCTPRDAPSNYIYL